MPFRVPGISVIPRGVSNLESRDQDQDRDRCLFLGACFVAPWGDGLARNRHEALAFLERRFGCVLVEGAGGL